ncbi:MAG TPA: AAA family ATPase, partial [Clostridia bacterium]|nr:AAA family ATPase [Clostridia bacterium]
MYLKRIEIYGFKSFADKLNISFGDGITAIVGPNGSGKSNVADAVRWVLGEQNVRSLRGAKMEDVIFGGTEQRKALSYCEVTLVFDNSDGTLEIDYSEVASRRLY